MNTIVILMDTLRRDHLGCFGGIGDNGETKKSPVETPNIDRFAAEATCFDNSYISSYPCMPARQDLFTGQLSFLRRGWSPLEYDQPDLPTLLSQSGARTALMTDHYHYWQYGAGNYHQAFNACEFIRGQENDNYRTGDASQTEYPAPPEKLNDRWHRYWHNTSGRRNDDDYFTAQVFVRSMHWLEDNARRTGDGDFFLMLDCFDPHEPFDPPIEFARPYLPEGWEEHPVRPVWPRYGESEQYTQYELDVIHGLYCGEIAFLDHWFGKFYQQLKDLELLEDTAVILTSDHGWLFGEHHWLGKHSHLLYDEIVHTPLIVSHPALPKGRNEALVQMADLMPTILDIMEVPIPETVCASSLAGLWDEDKPGDVAEREALIFGVFGGETYCTDGEYVLAKRPNATNTPLYWYTRSHFNNWDFGQVNYWQDSVKRVDQYDGTRFPVQYENAYPRHAAPAYTDEDDAATEVRKQDALYDLRCDPRQEHDLAEERPDLVQKYRAEMKRLMRRYEAPDEQYERLGLE